MRGFVALMLALAPIAAAHATDDDLSSVAAMTGRARVLVAFARNLQDPRMVQQRAEIARFAIGGAQRDLVFVQVDLSHVIGATDHADELRARYGVSPNSFRNLLIDKNGKLVFTSGRPLLADRMAQVIDTLPSRQEEVRRARTGRPPEANP